MQRNLAKQIVGGARAAVNLQKVMGNGPAKVEIAQQGVVARELGLGHRKIQSGEGFTFSRRWAGYYSRVNRLKTLHVIQPGP